MPDPDCPEDPEGPKERLFRASPRGLDENARDVTMILRAFGIFGAVFPADALVKYAVAPTDETPEFPQGAQNAP